MRKTSKFFGFLLAAALIVTPAGCDGGGDGDTQPTPNSPAVSDSTPTPNSGGNNNGGNNDDRDDPGDRSDPGDTDIPEWWGEYINFESDECWMYISEFDGTSFWFEIYSYETGGTMLAGTAVLYPVDNRIAEYGEIAFYLYDDNTAFDFFAPDGSEWAYLRGQYTKMEWQGDDGRGDLFPDDIADRSDPGDQNLPEWRGNYIGDGFAIEITNFNGTGFAFAISNLRNGEYIYEGVAALDPDFSQAAVYEQVGFYLYDDFSAVDFYAAEGSGWEHLWGRYDRLD